MRSSRNYPAMQVKVGTLLAVAVAVTLLAMIFPTKGVNPFSSKFRLVAFFPAVAGLRTSSPVWFSGVEVGTVTYVDFVPGSDPPRLKVILKVERKVQKYLKTDSQAVIKSMGLLGDMYIELTPGSPSAPVVENGAEVAGVPPDNTGEMLNQMMVSAKSVLNNLDLISRDIQSGQGSLGQLVKDPGLYRELRDTLDGLKRFVNELNQSQGTAMKLVQDPALYEQLVAAVKDMRAVIDDLKHAEEKVLSPETKAALDETVKTASRVVKRVGEYQEKIDRIRFDLNFGVDRYVDPIANGHADLMIWPSSQRYYQVGIQKISSLYGLEKDQTSFRAELAWQILDTPFYIRGGVIKNEYFVAGLDLRLFDNRFSTLLDVYRLEFDPTQVDVQAGVLLLDVLELTAGAEDILRHPFYKAGLTIHYQDEDLINIGLKTKF